MKQNWKQIIDTIVSIITSITELIMPDACFGYTISFINVFRLCEITEIFLQNKPFLMKFYF